MAPPSASIRTGRREAKRVALFAILVASTSQAVAAVGTQGNDELRLEAIGYRLAVANGAVCPQPEMLTGMLLHDISAYAPRVRAAAATALGLTSGFGVRHVVPGSTADQAGIRDGDEIIAIGETDLAHFETALIGDTPSYERVSRFNTLLDRTLRSGPSKIMVRRGEQLLAKSLAGAAGCGGRTVLEPSNRLGAWSDGRYIAVTSRMVRSIRNDDELAFLIAHEMSHNMLGHATDPTGSGLLSTLGIGTGQIKQDELAADANAIGLMARSGYDLGAARRLLEYWARTHLAWPATTHPGTDRRIANVDREIAKYRKN